jgi:hypothetical protein
MWRSVAIVACSLVLAVVPAEAKNNKGPLSCGNYDGAPSPNGCAPVSAELQTKCQKWIDKGNATLQAQILQVRGLPLGRHATGHYCEAEGDASGEEVRGQRF